KSEPDDGEAEIKVEPGDDQNESTPHPRNVERDPVIKREIDSDSENDDQPRCSKVSATTETTSHEQQRIKSEPDDSEAEIKVEPCEDQNESPPQHRNVERGQVNTARHQHHNSESDDCDCVECLMKDH